MNAHFANAVNSVAFTWGRQKVYHAAQFGDRNSLPVSDQLRDIDLHAPQELSRHARQIGGRMKWGPLDLQLPDRPFPAEPGGVPHEEWMRGAQNDARIRANHLQARDQSEFPQQLPSFLQEPFEGDETGPEIDTHEDLSDEDKDLLAKFHQVLLSRRSRGRS